MVDSCACGAFQAGTERAINHDTRYSIPSRGKRQPASTALVEIKARGSGPEKPIYTVRTSGLSPMNVEIYKFFYKVVTNSLSTQQVNYLGSRINRNFDLNREAGYSASMPVPRQTAAQTLLDHFSDEEDIIELFTYMLDHEGERFYNRTLAIWGRDDFIALLKKNKWVYDEEVGRFMLDPFYEHEINFLKKIRLIDLRKENPVADIINQIAEISKKMGIQDLEWRISMRLYDLESKTGELIRKIIGLLLARQNLQVFTSDLFVCLKELAINASKANYKLLYNKHVTAPKGITSDRNYQEFLEMFRNEIDENGNRNLMELARKDDKYINITFQSTREAIEIWVTNNQGVSTIEKHQIMKRLGAVPRKEDSFFNDDDDLVEGAGLGINLILKILHNYTKAPNPLKVIFYPESLKIGFRLTRDEMKEKLPPKTE